MNNFDIDTHIAKKEVEIEKHREFLAYMEGLGLMEHIYNHMVSVVSSKIAQCEISIRDHRKYKPSAAGVLDYFGRVNLRKDFEVAKKEVTDRVVMVTEGRTSIEDDMQYFEFIPTVPYAQIDEIKILILETIVYKRQLVCKISACDSGQITIYPYIEL